MMIKTTLKIEGMMCPMCEAHVNDAIRSGFAVESVKSSHKDKQTVIVSKEALPEEAVREAINKTGYTVTSYASETYEKKAFHLFGNK